MKLKKCWNIVYNAISWKYFKLIYKTLYYYEEEESSIAIIFKIVESFVSCMLGSSSSLKIHELLYLEQSPYAIISKQLQLQISQVLHVCVLEYYQKVFTNLSVGMCSSQRSLSWILQLFNYPYDILAPSFEDMKFWSNLMMELETCSEMHQVLSSCKPLHCVGEMSWEMK